jgi:hypothetical protein
MANYFKKSVKITFGILFIFPLGISFSGCSKINMEHITYNKEAQLYEYPVSRHKSVWLRNENDELVTNSNYNDFIVELLENKGRYPFEERQEAAETLKESDYKIATLYSESAKKINDQKFTESASKIDTLRQLYSKSALYSDAAFIEGYALEKAGDTTEAKVRYKEYLDYSSKKYSERFRGYKYADQNDSLWLQQRKYARDFMNEKPVREPVSFKAITPKYYFNSLQPGYGLNDETLVESKQGLIFIGLATNFSSDIALSMQIYRSLNKYIDINPAYYTSGNMRAFNAAMPVQLYLSENNNLGIKLSPFINYSNISKIYFEGTEWETDENIFNFGFKISGGYYFMQRLSLGAYYTYFYYNENHPYNLKTQPLNIWWHNQYDVSLYLNISKGFSFKTGIKSGDLVAGIYWNGWEISYSFFQPAFISQADLY